MTINGEQINQIVYFGKATPRQATMDPTGSFYEDWIGKYYIEHDPKRANKLLDEMGLKWDKKHQYRLRPDGKTLAVTVEFCMGDLAPILELVKDYWEKLGVKIALKAEERSYYLTRLRANKCDVGVWAYDGTSEFRERVTWPMGRYRPPWHCPGGCEMVELV